MTHCKKGHKYKILTQSKYSAGYAICNGCKKDIRRPEKHLHCPCDEDWCSKCMFKSNTKVKVEIKSMKAELNSAVKSDSKDNAQIRLMKNDLIGKIKAARAVRPISANPRMKKENTLGHIS